MQKSIMLRTGRAPIQSLMHVHDNVILPRLWAFPVSLSSELCCRSGYEKILTLFCLSQTRWLFFGAALASGR